MLTNELNVARHSSGFVVRKIFKKYEKKGKYASNQFEECLGDPVVDEDIHGDV